VCRFYGRPEAGLDSHFYSASAAECQAVIDRFPAAWALESRNVFEVVLPNMSDGSCPLGTKPLYRLYNNRADVNHRYTTSLATRATMIAAGWIPEGYGTLGVTMCVPNM
jgi:serine protease